MRPLFLPVLALAFGGLIAYAQQPCESLTGLNLPDLKIQSAVAVSAGDFKIPGAAESAAPAKVPSFCRVVAIVQPELKFELFLPAQWNRKFIVVGNGGMAGSIPYAAMLDPLNRGYATAGTDAGHTSNNDDGEWALGHLDRILNYAYRGIHLTALAGKAVTKAFYGSAATHSFFTGCSFGGKQALTAVQRYPADFDGVVAGDPANNFIRHYVAGHLWAAMAVDGDGYIPAAKIPVIGNAVNAACDALDGIKDGILNDPRKCHFDPSLLECKAGDAADCLTHAQVVAVQKIWGGLRDANGQLLYPGILPGGEVEPGGWGRYMAGPGPGQGRHAMLTNAFFRYFVFENPEWDFHQFRFTAPAGFENDLEVTEDKAGPMFNAMDTDLRPFRALGGKLIQYHGFSDPDIPPENSIQYFESVVRSIGGPRNDPKALQNTKNFYRLFMVPGMQHCAGGPGPNRFDMLTALEQWVEQNKAPEQVIASHMTAGKVDRTRPLCAWPMEAKYKGSGSTDDAANFSCALP